MRVRERLYLISIILFIGLGIFIAFTTKDEVVGLAKLLALFFSGIAAGASLTAFRMGKRQRLGKR